MRTTALVLVMALTINGSAASGQTMKSVNFADHPQPITFVADGVEVTLQPTKSDGDLIDVSAAIRVPGYQSFITMEGAGSSPYYDRDVGIGKLSTADPVATVLLQSFTGGAHCCATLKAIVPVAGRLKVLEFEAVDGDGSKTFPKDVDGDGTVDFVRQDDRFRYQFASGAGSYSPPMIFNIYKGQIIDVSVQPSFRPLWEAFANETRTACADKSNRDRNGACAAYVAAGARLGRYQISMLEADKLANQSAGIELPTRCTVALVQYVCPTGKEAKFYTFKSALTWFLQDAGYVD